MSPARKKSDVKPQVSRFPERRGVRAPAAADAPTLTLALRSIEVRNNGWPGEMPREADLSLVLQLARPAGGPPVDSDRLAIKARSGTTLTPADLPAGANGSPMFGGPVNVKDHVNLHVRFFVERTNTIGPVVGAALNTVIGEVSRRFPLLPEPPREALHVQIGKTIATELARGSVIVPVEASNVGSHEVALSLVSPLTGEIAAVVTLTIELHIPA